MTSDVRCPRCGMGVDQGTGCRHLRWVPGRGNPIDFAKSVLAARPITEGDGLTAGAIGQEWWESQYDWLLDRIMVRLDVVDGYCFGDPVDLDRLRLDIWHRFAPQADRGAVPSVRWEAGSGGNR